MAMNVMLERQRGQLECDLSHLSMHCWWKAWLHLGSSRRLSPSLNSPRQTEQSVVWTKASPRLYLHKGLIQAGRWRHVPGFLTPGLSMAAAAAATTTAAAAAGHGSAT
nr:unnamed protein product [Digitaria exilis]